MKILRYVFFGLIAVPLAGFLVWAWTPPGPAPEALAALRSGPRVQVSLDDYIVFQPADRTPSTGLLFYPGGRVDYRSYAAPLQRIAAEGYLVILLPVRLNLAIVDSRAADRARPAFPSIERWAVGGHSLGGVAAALYASGQGQVDGLVLWAAYPADDALADSTIPVLSVYGTLDMAGLSAFEEARPLLPADTQYVVIQGGNHAQFGDYGIQAGDEPAQISRAEQQGQAVEATVRFLRELGE